MKIYSYLLDGVQEFIKDDIPALSSKHSIHMNTVHSGGYTYIADVTTLELEAANDCNLAIMKEQFSPMYYALGMQNNSVYNDLFSAQ